MPAFPISQQIPVGEVFSLKASDFKHLKNSLRIKVGHDFEILLPNGQKAVAKLVKTEQGLQGKIKSILPILTSPPLPLWIGAGLLRWPRFEWIIEKATELGVKRVTPLITARTRHQEISSISDNKLNRLIKISQETLKQCERAIPMQIDAPQSLKEWFKDLSQETGNPTQRILFNENIQEPLFHSSQLRPSQTYTLLIGPEGGFPLEEIKMATEQGFEGFSLGSKRLRAETAAVYGVAIIDSYLSG